MKTLYKLICIGVILNSCRTGNLIEPDEETIPGGKNGTYHIAIFPEYKSSGYSGKVYIKYGTKKSYSSTDYYNDSSATMAEPGFKHHAHFNYLKEGYYAIKSVCMVNSKWMMGDTIIEIKKDQLSPADVKVQLK